MQAASHMSRRAILGAAAVASTLVLASPAHAHRTPAAPGRAEWDRAYAIMEHAVREDAAYDPIYMKTFRAFEADAPDPDAVECRRALYHPHYRAWLSDDIDAYQTAWLEERGKTWWGDCFEQLGRQQIDQVREYRRLRAVAEERHNMPAIEAEWERLGDVAYSAKWALFGIPAPDLAALAWKSEHLYGEAVDEGHEAPAYNPDIIATYMADVRRLLAGKV